MLNICLGLFDMKGQIKNANFGLPALKLLSFSPYLELVESTWWHTDKDSYICVVIDFFRNRVTLSWDLLFLLSPTARANIHPYQLLKYWKFSCSLSKELLSWTPNPSTPKAPVTPTLPLKSLRPLNDPTTKGLIQARSMYSWPGSGLKPEWVSRLLNMWLLNIRNITLSYRHSFSNPCVLQINFIDNNRAQRMDQ